MPVLVAVATRHGSTAEIAVDDVAAATPAIGHRLFAGKLEVSEVGAFARLGPDVIGMCAGGYRDFGEIRAWAASIGDALHDPTKALLRPTAAMRSLHARARVERGARESARREWIRLPLVVLLAASWCAATRTAAVASIVAGPGEPRRDRRAVKRLREDARR